METIEYACIYSLWNIGFSLCMLCCIKTNGYCSVEAHVGGKGWEGVAWRKCREGVIMDGIFV